MLTGLLCAKIPTSTIYVLLKHIGWIDLWPYIILAAAYEKTAFILALRSFVRLSFPESKSLRLPYFHSVLFPRQRICDHNRNEDFRTNKISIDMLQNRCLATASSSHWLCHARIASSMRRDANFGLSCWRPNQWFLSNVHCGEKAGLL